MKTYQELIYQEHGEDIYFDIQRHLEYLKWRAGRLGLNLPLVAPEHHCNKQGYYETASDRVWNDELTKQTKGSFFCEDDQEAAILKAHGWTVELTPGTWNLTNPGTGYNWSQQLWLCQN